MKKLLFCIGLSIVNTLCFGQTAPDFSAIDCNGDPQNLYTELNNGKTVIVIWVMPCIGCVNGTLAADSTKESISVTYPNNVLLWIVDDGPPSNCSTFPPWIASIGLQPQRTFGNYNNEIDQDNYGGFGMPHLMVVGANKQIYYNEFNTSGENLYDAVLNAVNLTTSVTKVEKSATFSLSPNPASDNITIQAKNAIASVSLISITGQVIQKYTIGGQNNPIVQIGNIAPDTYFVQVVDVTGKTGIQKLLKTKQ